jgi:hypothetical protein
MRVTTEAICDIETGKLLCRRSYEYDGPVALCGKKKKGRQGVARMADLQEQVARWMQDIREAEYRKAEPQISMLEGTEPGGLSPLAKAEYESDIRNIGDVYKRQREAGFRAIGAKGFGRAPAGAESSMLATLGRGKARDLTDALARAFGRTHEQRTQALSARLGREQLYDPVRPSRAAGEAWRSHFEMRPRRLQQASQAIGVAGAGMGFGTGLAGLLRKTPS